MTYESFIENGLLLQKAPNASAIPTAVAAALDADKHDIMISTLITTLVTYVKNPDANAMDVLKSCCRKSQGISDSKLNSAKPNPNYLIGVFGEAYMKTMPLENLTHQLDTGGSAKPVIQRITATVAIKNLKTPLAVLPQFPLLDHPDVQAYAKNPLDEKKRMKAELALKCDVVSTATSQK